MGPERLGGRRQGLHAVPGVGRSAEVAEHSALGGLLGQGGACVVVVPYEVASVGVLRPLVGYCWEGGREVLGQWVLGVAAGRAHQGGLLGPSCCFPCPSRAVGVDHDCRDQGQMVDHVVGP